MTSNSNFSRSKAYLCFTKDNVCIRRRTSVNFWASYDKENVLRLSYGNPRYIWNRLQTWCTQQTQEAQLLWTDCKNCTSVEILSTTNSTDRLHVSKNSTFSTFCSAVCIVLYAIYRHANSAG